MDLGTEIINQLWILWLSIFTSNTINAFNPKYSNVIEKYSSAPYTSVSNHDGF